VKYLNGRYHFGDLSLDRRIILKVVTDYPHRRYIAST
jgi:hypothetical protein